MERNIVAAKSRRKKEPRASLAVDVGAGNGMMQNEVGTSRPGDQPMDTSNPGSTLGKIRRVLLISFVLCGLLWGEEWTVIFLYVYPTKCCIQGSFCGKMYPKGLIISQPKPC